MSVFRRLANKLRLFRQRRVLQEGRVVSRFVARDVRRDVLVMSAARLDEGIITARVRTTNVLYVARGLATAPEFGDPVVLQVSRLWEWSGASWGGLPDGRSIVKPR